MEILANESVNKIMAGIMRMEFIYLLRVTFALRQSYPEAQENARPNHFPAGTNKLDKLVLLTPAEADVKGPTHFISDSDSDSSS